MTVAPAVAREHTTIRPVPKPERRPAVSGNAARRLAEAQGHAFADIAADLKATDAIVVAKTIDRRRDAEVRQALRLVRLARRDRVNAASYLVLANGHLCEAIRLDQIKDEHDSTVELHVGASIEAGRACVGVQESLLSVSEP